MSKEKKTYSVFISSTFIDNQERRKIVEDAVLRANMQPVGMERFTATANPTIEECERKARKCDIYVGIIAHRYGWIPEGKAVSITELEYDAAKAVARPRLMFEIDPSLPVFPDNDYDQGADKWDKQKLLEAFRAKYRKDQMPAPFKESSLSGMVVQALNEWREAQEGEKPDPHDRTPERGPLAPELERYRETAVSLHASLPLAGFKTKLRVPIGLEALYVPLQAIVDLRATGECAFADAGDAEAKLREHGSQEIPLVEAFREANKRKRRGLVMLGDPGSGKTTYLKRLLLSCLRERPAGLGLPEGTLPVFLPLRELHDLSKGIGAFIEKTLDSPHLKMAEGFGARLLERGHLLLLFDGLDEVSDPGQRAEVARWIEQGARAQPTCTAVVTCRFAGYEEARLGPEFLELHLRPLTREQSETFIRNWYRAVETGLALDTVQGERLATERAEELIERLAGPDFRSARVLEMTRNPLLLTNLCLVHRDRGGLPRGRHQLYDECIEVLLERWRENKALPVRVSAATGRRVLQPAALWLHEKKGRTRASVDELAPIMEPALKAAKWAGGDAAALLRTVRDESGLLTGWGPEQYGFMHLGFQEYLAACELRRKAFEGDKDAVLGELASHYGQSWWQEVILLLLAQGNPSLFAPFMRKALRQPLFDGAHDWLDLVLEESAEISAAPFLELLEEAPGRDSNHWAQQGIALRVLERLVSAEEYRPIMEALRNHPASHLRAWIGGRMETTDRPGRVTSNGGVELVSIPGGRFRMGSSEGEGDDDERPAHEVDVRPFYLGRYPATNEEYARFMQANPGIEEPAYWSDRRSNQARQPVVGVSWDEAQSFAEWAGGRLPTEAEWEYAARAGTSTQYWWGDDIGSNRANGAATGSPWSGKQTSPVGSFEPNPFGLYDTAGNVWEWVQDLWHDDYRGAPGDGSAWKAGGAGGLRVIRGGSWSYDPESLRSAYRDGSSPDNRHDSLGFRLAQDL